jgi:membrane protein
VKVSPGRYAKSTGQVIWQTLRSFMSDGCPAMAAALSFYTIFSLPPLLAILMLIVGSLVDPATLRDLLSTQVGTLLGPRGGQQVIGLLENASHPEISSVAAILGILALAFGATTAFANMQSALNTAWNVAPNPKRGDVRNFLLKRVVSLTMVLAVGFLLVVSLVVSAALAGFGQAINASLPGGLSAGLLQTIDFLVSFVVIGLLFALLFCYVPDAIVRWRDALVGGGLTGLLFIIGKGAIGLYIGQSDPGDVFGAAGSLAVALLWLYYNAIILLMGAEFTQVWATRRGAPIIPEQGAVRVIQTTEPVVRR